MSCCGAPATFRLLDAYVGWDPAVDPSPAIVGLDDPDGIRLGVVDPDAVDPHEVDRRLGAGVLARACSPCVWYLVVPRRVLWRDPCGCPDARGCLPFVIHRRLSALVRDPVAIVAGRTGVAVLDRGGFVAWQSPRRDRTPALFDVPNATAIAFGRRGELLVATRGGSLRRFDPAGAELAAIAAPAEPIVRMRVATDGTLWAAIDRGAGELGLVSLARAAVDWTSRTLAELVAAFPEALPDRVDARGFCLRDSVPAQPDRVCCYDWHGRPLADDGVAVPVEAVLHEHGVLETLRIDSEIPRCRWHRVRVDADVPLGTSVRVEVASTEDGATPDPADWNGIASDRADPTDFLVDQPPGRYLYVRIVLRGDGRATPVVRRVRIDMPRITSADLLPEVYRTEPIADDFIERFLSLFDAPIGDLDRAIERFTAMFDVGDTPTELLPWLGSFIGVAFDPSWAPDVRRALLAAAPELWRGRGTVAALRRVIEIVTGEAPAIREPAREHLYGAIGHSTRLGETRLFGRLQARFRLDASPLGAAPLLVSGNPDADPLTEGAWRLEIALPAYGSADAALLEQRLQRLVEQHKPAHTVASVRLGGTGFVLGPRSMLGIDTRIGTFPAPVLGRDGNVRLRRSSVLWRRSAS